MDPINTSLQNMHRYSLNSQASPRDTQSVPRWGSQVEDISLNEEDEEDKQDIADLPASKRSYVVISGGTAANDFVHAFGTDCAFVLPGKSMSVQA
jgi:hypothetical protein